MINNLFRILLAALFLALSACTATKLKGTWLNPKYEGKDFQRVLVLGVSSTETYLRIFEESMSRGLNQRGVQAEPGYALFPDQERPDKKLIAREISDKGFDAMIISRVTGKSTEEVIYPGETYYVRDPYYMPPLHSGYWYDYYFNSYAIVREPGYVRQYKIVTVQSNIYDTQAEELIWSAVSETVVNGDVEGAINSLVDTLINEIAKIELIQR
jgi:hypothetical protein